MDYLNYLNLNELNNIDSALVSLMNYMNELKFKEDIRVMKNKLEIGRELRSLDFARKMKVYNLVADYCYVEFKDIKKYKGLFPLFACLKKDKTEYYVLIYDITDLGIITKDINTKEQLIRIEDFKQYYNDRIIVIKDKRQFVKKYSYLNEIKKLRKIASISGASLYVLCWVIAALIYACSPGEATNEMSKNEWLFVVFMLLILFAIFGPIYLISRFIFDDKKKKLEKEINTLGNDFLLVKLPIIEEEERLD